MDAVGLLLLVVGTLLILLVSGNNAQASIGNLIGAKVVRPRTALSIEIVGVSLGLLIQGNIMATAASNLARGLSSETILTVLTLTLALFVVAHFARLPLSLTHTLPALLVGVALAFTPYFFLMILAWMAAPAAALVATPLIARLAAKPGANEFWDKIEVYKALLILVSFIFAFTMGANAIGLIVAVEGFGGLAVPLAIVGVVVGTFFLSAGEIRRVTSDMFNLGYSNAMSSMLTSAILVEASTLVGIPMANTMVQNTAVFGAGISYKTRFFSAKPFFLVALSWVVFPAAGIAAGALIALM
ncbi:MAG TPA: inorganic phosphate transporter [Nitrososphaerales archaeon]|nr:inorganic phosphate transporter [Nitrososphaerales archaeon]